MNRALYACFAQEAAESDAEPRPPVVVAAPPPTLRATRRAALNAARREQARAQQQRITRLLHQLAVSEAENEEKSAHLATARRAIIQAKDEQQRTSSLYDRLAKEHKRTAAIYSTELKRLGIDPEALFRPRPELAPTA